MIEFLYLLGIIASFLLGLSVNLDSSKDGRTPPKPLPKRPTPPPHPPYPPRKQAVPFCVNYKTPTYPPGTGPK